MGLGVVRDLKALAGGQHELAAVFQLDFQLTLETKEHVAFGAPVTGQIAGSVLDDAHANVAEVARAPERSAGLALVLGGCYRRPVGGAEGYIGDFHQSVPARSLCDDERYRTTMRRRQD